MSTLSFRPIDPSFNACVHTMCKAVWPQGFDVSDKAPETFEDLKAEYAARGRITVWSGASDDTIFDDPGTNHMFRAWHDWCHLHGDFAFDADGELGAALMQCSQVRDQFGNGETAEHFCKLIMIEVVGQCQYEALHGEFPKDQMQFTKAYLNLGPAAAIYGNF